MENKNKGKELNDYISKVSSNKENEDELQRLRTNLKNMEYEFKNKTLEQ